MRRRRSNVPVYGPPDPILFHYSDSNASIAPVTYIVCLHGRVPERYELLSMNAQGVCKVHPFSQVIRFDDFCEDTLRNTFFNSRRCRIPFIGQRPLNGSVEFLHFADVTSDSTKDAVSTRNIFVHEWGYNPTMIGPTCSNYTCRAYVPITSQKGLCQRYNHERLRLKWVKGKRVALECHLSRVRQDMRDGVAANYTSAPLNNALVDASPANSLKSSSSNDSDSGEEWVHISGSIL